AGKGDSWTAAERSVAARHFPACDEIRDVHARSRQFGLQTVRLENRELVFHVQRSDLDDQFRPLQTEGGELCRETALRVDRGAQDRAIVATQSRRRRGIE